MSLAQTVARGGVYNLDVLGGIFMHPSPRLLTVVAALALTHGVVHAQPSDGSAAPASTDDDGASPTLGNPSPIQYGVGFRLRNVRVPQAELELFVERSGGGASNLGLGLDFVRRRGDLELQLGFEYEKITPGSGVWIKKGDNVAAGAEADYILTPEQAGEALGWFTIEFTFLNHAAITDQFAIRYGGGAGLGIVTGSLQRYDIICNGATNEMPEPGCVPPRFSGNGSYSGGDAPKKYELPPVFPVVNAIIGLQFKPNENVTINLEGGIRTLLFFGLSGAYFF